MPTKKSDKTSANRHAVGTARAATAHADNALLRARQGHGFAAERANHLVDVAKGKRARIVGTDNAKAGADRIVDGLHIQSKYCATARDTVNACFTRSGKLIYTHGGRPMKIEVPKDQFEEAVKLMAKKLQTGERSRATALRMAKNIVISGNIDGETAHRIVQAGNIDSVTFDAANGAMAAGMAGSLSVALAYAGAIWNGADKASAAREACVAGLQVGGVTWLSSVATAQLSKSGAEAVVREGSQWLVKQLGKKATLTIANTLNLGERALRSQVLEQGARRLTGKAAEGYLARSLTGNALAAAATTLVLSANDLRHVFAGRISMAQLLKNVTNTAAGVAGGTSGTLAGAAKGWKYLGWMPGGPPVGALVGGILGGLVGSTSASTASHYVTDWLIEDDAVEMMRTLEEVFVEEVQDQLLTQAEADRVLVQLHEKWDLAEQLREMFASVDPEQYARWLLRPLVTSVVGQRKKVRLPSEKILLKCAAELLSQTESSVDQVAPKTPSSSKVTLSQSVAWPFPTSSRP